MTGTFQNLLHFWEGTSPSDSPLADLLTVVNWNYTEMEKRKRDANFREKSMEILKSLYVEWGQNLLKINMHQNAPYHGHISKFSSLLRGHIPLRHPLARSTTSSQLIIGMAKENRFIWRTNFTIACCTFLLTYIDIGWYVLVFVALKTKNK